MSPTGSSAGSATPALVVVVVADTRARADQLRSLLSDPGFAVAAEVCSAKDAEAAVVAHRPGVVLLDLDPASGGIEAIERIMGTRPTPVVVCGSLAEHAGAALAAGAVDVVAPTEALPSSPAYGLALRRHLRIASRALVITHPRNKLRVRGIHGAVAPDERPAREQRNQDAGHATRRLVVIGASTGGPPALATILAGLPADLPASVLVVQHMAEGFVEGLATWLNGLSPMRVVMATHGARLLPGTVYVAPAGLNTLVGAGLRIVQSPPVDGQFHVPGVDELFTSAAVVCRDRAVGVLLTGMGRDGAAGLQLLRDRGAPTLGQDEATSVVWGMPSAAKALGAVGLELPLPQIAEAIVEAVRRPAVVTS